MTSVVGRLRRAGTRALSALATVGLAAATAPPSQGVGIPTDPDNPAVAQQWANPAIRAEEGTRATVELVDAPASLAAHAPLSLTVRVTNRSDETLEGLTVTPRRGPATGSVHDQRAATVADISEYSAVGKQRDADKPLAPGESTELTFEIPETELPLPGLNTYPMMLVLAGEQGVLDTDRFHIAVRGAADEPRAGLTALYPVSAPVDIVPGETGTAPDPAPLLLSSEQLADQLAPGGRLSELVRIFNDATADEAAAHSACMALDPALVDTVDRMARGYTVSTQRPDVVEQPKRLRDSWGSADNTVSGETGRGAEDAKTWLDAVRDIAATRCIVALPWANSDVNAVARTGDTWLMREAVERGPFTLEKVLGARGVENAVLPGTGYIEPGVAPALGWADHSRSAVGEDGMAALWESARDREVRAERRAGGRIDAEHRAALDQSFVPGPERVAAPEPAAPVRALVADSTVQHDQAGERFSWLSPGVMAVEHQGSLASVLASVGPHPETTGYSPQSLRSPLNLDSQTARAVNAAAAVHLAVANARAAAGEGESPAPVMVTPPAAWDAADAAMLMEAVSGELRDAAEPLSLEQYLTVPASDPADVSRETPFSVPQASQTGTPENDPTVFSDQEILTAVQQAKFADDLTGLLINDGAIALRPYGFTLPLRRDILAALTVTGRRAQDNHMAAVQATRDRLAANRDTMNKLRSSITLIPPGNVYTRASSSSPLLIVAQNGLPLPVATNILYTGPEGARLNTPSDMRIPAHGSVTVQMTADLPDNRDTDLKLFLASADGEPISQPVDITVRTAEVAMRGWTILGALVAGFAVLLVVTAGRRRKARARPPGTAPPGPEPPGPEPPNADPPPTSNGRPQTQ